MSKFVPVVLLVELNQGSIDYVALDPVADLELALDIAANTQSHLGSPESYWAVVQYSGDKPLILADNLQSSILKDILRQDLTVDFAQIDLA